MNNTDYIKITEDFAEMEAIGKSLVEAKSTVYTPEVLAALYGSVERHMRGTDKDVQERRLYRAIYNYWMYGNTIDEDFYLGFDLLNSEQKLEYATMRWRMAYYNFLNDTSLAHLFDNKEETFCLFKDYYHRDVIAVRDKDDWDAFEDFTNKHKSFVVKPNNMSTGVGIRRISIPEGVSSKQVFADIMQEYNGYTGNSPWRKKTTAVIIEELIQQDEALAKLHPGSVNGIRATTVRVGGEVHIYQPWIKVGAQGAFVASAVLGGMDIGINAGTGVLETAGYGELGETYQNHPDTGVKFIGYQIPKWNELVALAKELASGLPPRINYIGWDFVLTPQGWCIMEGNFRGDFMWQLFRQRGMRREFEDLIGWKSTKKYWWE